MSKDTAATQKGANRAMPDHMSYRQHPNIWIARPVRTGVTVSVTINGITQSINNLSVNVQ